MWFDYLELALEQEQDTRSNATRCKVEQRGYEQEGRFSERLNFFPLDHSIIKTYEFITSR